MGHEQLNVRIPADLAVRFSAEVDRRAAVKAEVVRRLLERWLVDPRLTNGPEGTGGERLARDGSSRP